MIDIFWIRTPEVCSQAFLFYRNRKTEQRGWLDTVPAPSMNHFASLIQKPLIIRCSVRSHATTILPERDQSTIRAGHDSPKWILNWSDATGMLAGEQIGFLELDFDSIHRATIRSEDADALSVLVTGGEHSTDVRDDIPVSVIDINKNKSKKKRTLRIQ